MDQRFLDETVCRKPELFKAMVDFNRPRQERSAVAALRPLGELGNALLSDPVIRKALNSNSPAQGTSDSWWDFSDETFRLLLIEDAVLKKAALSFSAAVYAEELSLVIDRELVLKLRALLGEEIFSYALRRGRYQIGSLRSFLTSQFTSGALDERIAMLASAILFRLADSWPERVRNLWLAKLRSSGMLSQELADIEEALPSLSREQRRALWFTLKKLLLREAAPQWVPCFD